MSEDEVDAQLDKVLRLLTYISDKDLFNEFYKKKLGRRLLNDNNTQDDAERSALSKLKQQFGTQFTSKVGISKLLDFFPFTWLITVPIRKKAKSSHSFWESDFHAKCFEAILSFSQAKQW